MSVYLDMWEKIKELTDSERSQWLNRSSLLTGAILDFYGVKVIDIDLFEALSNYN